MNDTDVKSVMGTDLMKEARGLQTCDRRRREAQVHLQEVVVNAAADTRYSRMMFELKAPCQKWKVTQSCASAQSKATADLHSQKLTETHGRGAASRGTSVTLSAQRSRFTVGPDLQCRQTETVEPSGSFHFYRLSLSLMFPSDTSVQHWRSWTWCFRPNLWWKCDVTQPVLGADCQTLHCR